MMPLRPICPGCKQKLKLPENVAGKRVRCPACATVFAVDPPPAATSVAAAQVVESPPPVPPAPEPPAPESPESGPLPFIDTLVEPGRAAPAPAAGRGRPIPAAGPGRVGPKPGRPKSRRQTVGLLLLGLVLAGGLVAYAVTSGLAQRLYVAVTGGSIPAGDWKTFAPPGGAFSVSLPGVPTPMPTPAVPGTTLNKWGLTLSIPRRAFGVGYFELPADRARGPQALTLDRLVQGETAGMAADGNTLVTTRAWQVGDRLGGTELEFKTKRGDVALERVCLVETVAGTRCYILIVEGPDLRPNTPEVAQFFNSFAPELPRGARPGPQPTPEPPEAPKLAGDRLAAHEGGAVRLRYSPDGKTLATLGWDGSVRLWEVPGYRLRRTLPARGGSPHDLAFSPDGKRLAVAAGPAVNVYDAAGEHQQRLAVRHSASGDNTEVTALAFGPGGDTLAAVAHGQQGGDEVHLREVLTDRARRPPLQMVGTVPALSFSPDGALLAVAVDKEVHLLDAGNLTPRRLITGHATPVRSLAFSADGRLLATGEDRLIKIWPLPQGEFLHALEGHHSLVGGKLVFSPDGKLLASTGNDGCVCLWEVASGEEVAFVASGNGDIGAVDFSGDSRTLTFGAGNQPLRLWDVAQAVAAGPLAEKGGRPLRPEEVARLNNIHGPVAEVAFSPTGPLLATCGPGDLKLWKAADWQRRSFIQGHHGPMTFAWAADGRRLLAAGGNGDARVYLRDGASGHLLADFPAEDGAVQSAALSPDGKLAVVALAVPSGSAVRFWDVSGPPRRLPAEETVRGEVRHLRFRPDGRALYAVSGRSVLCWDAQTRKQAPPLAPAHAALTCLAVSPDGQTVVAGAGGLVCLWETEGGRLTRFCEGHSGAVLSAAFAPDGQTLATVAQEGAVVLWDPASGQARARFDSGDAPGALSFSHDGTLLALATGRNTVVVCDKARLLAVAVPPLPATESVASTEPAVARQFNEPVARWTHAAFSPDGKTLLTVTGSSLLRAWDWPGGRLRDQRPLSLPVDLLAWGGDGRRLACASGLSVGVRDAGGRLLQLWPVQPAQPMSRPHVSALALSPDGAVLAAAVSEQQGPSAGELHLWGVKEGKETRAVKVGHGGVHGLAYSPDGKALLVGNHDGVRWYDAATLEAGRRLEGQEGQVGSLALSPDGSRLAVTAAGPRVKVWDLQEGKLLWGREGLGGALRFSPDGASLVIAGATEAELVNAADGKTVALLGRRGQVYYPWLCDFSPDGDFLALGTAEIKAPLRVLDRKHLGAKPGEP